MVVDEERFVDVQEYLASSREANGLIFLIWVISMEVHCALATLCHGQPKYSAFLTYLLIHSIDQDAVKYIQGLKGAIGIFDVIWA